MWETCIEPLADAVKCGQLFPSVSDVYTLRSVRWKKLSVESGKKRLSENAFKNDAHYLVPWLVPTPNTLNTVFRAFPPTRGKSLQISSTFWKILLLFWFAPRPPSFFLHVHITSYTPQGVTLVKFLLLFSKIGAKIVVFHAIDRGTIHSLKSCTTSVRISIVLVGFM